MALSVGVLVAEPDMAARAIDLVRAAGAVADSELFLMDEGVRAAALPALHALIADGAEVALCAADAGARGLIPDPAGPRFGSQWDHAVMVREARRVVAMTGGRIDDHTPDRAPGPGRVVAVRLTRAAQHPKTASALRAAVGYAGCGLSVVVVIEPEARQLLATEPSPQVARAVATLQTLGHRFTEVARVGQPVGADIEVSW